MDILKTYISSLDKKEREEFKKYLSIQGKTKDRIDVHLYQCISDNPEWDNNAIIQEIYSIKDEAKITAKVKNSYYQWRSILTGHMEDFCLHRVTNENKLLYVVKLFLLSRFLFNRKKFAAGFRYLAKAEALAMSSENYNLLDQIYALKFDFAWTQPNFKLEELLKDIKMTRERLQIENRSIEAYNILLFKLNAAKRKGEKIEYDKMLSEAKTSFGKRDLIKANSKAFYKFTMAVYLVLNEKLEFDTMMNHLISAYEFMEESGMFGTHNQRIKLELLTLIMRSAVLSKNFEKAAFYQTKLKELYRDFTENPILNFRSHVVEYVFLACTGRAKEAKEKIDYLEHHPTVQELIKEDNQAYGMLMANLISSSFSSGDYTQAKRHLFNVMNNEKRIRDDAGIQAVLFLYIVELMIYCGLKDYKTVLKKIPPLKKRFNSYGNFNAKENYSKSIEFFGAIAKSDGVISPELDEKIRDFNNQPNRSVIGTREFLPIKPFFNFLLNKTSYYEELYKYVQEKN